MEVRGDSPVFSPAASSVHRSSPSQPPPRPSHSSQLTKGGSCIRYAKATDTPRWSSSLDVRYVS